MKQLKLFLLVLLLGLPFAAIAQNSGTRQPIKKPVTSASNKAGAFIDVNVPPYPASDYTPEQLVKNVLISSGAACGTPNVSNVSVTPNLPATDQNRSWGYFHRADTTFPFKDGIIISTGYARKAGNTASTGTLSDNIAAGSDPDLVAAMGLPGGYTNSAVLEFDFVPTSTQIKFNYLLASEEYTSPFPCSFADGFVLLLRPVGSTGPYQNMAVLPGGAGPVSVTNIHPANGSDGGNLSCGAVNAQYFDSYNTNNVETNFMGRTIPLTATATVVPGQAYHFKMVVADYSSFGSDSSYDTAVFLEGGSFDIGVKLLDAAGAELPPEINVCDNTPTLLTASVDIPNATYKWFRDGIEIIGATTNAYTAILPGVYKIEVWVPGNNCPGTAQIEVHGGATPQAQNATYLLCATQDNQTFNLQQLQPLMSTTPGAQFKFYANQADAQALNNNFITNVTAFNTAGTTLFVVVSNGGFCYKIVELKLEKEQTPVAKVVANRTRVCEGEIVTLTASGGVTYDWVNFPGNGNTQTVTLTQTTTFKVYAIGEKGCKSAVPATITIDVLPKIKTGFQGAEICYGDTALLDPGIVGNNLTYLWSTGETTPTIIANQWGVYTLDIDNGICTQQFKFIVKAAPLPVISNLEYSNGRLVVNAVSVNQPLEYSIDGGISWQDSNVFNGIQNNTTITIKVRVKGTHCEETIDFFTAHINNVITPNYDGYNDVIDLRAFVDFDNFKAAIYDRYGAPMFEFSKMRPIWDGTIQGKRLPTGTYWYELGWKHKNANTTLKQTGWIMLKNRD